jgi:endoglucanase
VSTYPIRIGGVQCLTTVLLVGVLVGCTPAQLPSPVDSPASPEPQASIAPSAPAMERYLAGDEYLRGVNLYTLQQQRTLHVSEVEPDEQGTWDYLAGRGFSIVRLAVPWQGLQPIGNTDTVRQALGRDVSSAYLDLIGDQVEMAREAGLRVVVDLHNGCTYPWGTGERPAGTIDCGHGLEVTDVVKVWRAISDRFRDEPTVAAYNLFNEPRQRTGAETYFEYVQAIVDDLRDAGDDKVIWVDSILGSSFGSDSPNGAPIDDPAEAVIYSQHFYLHGTVENLLSGIRDFGEWCSNVDARCAIGEIGWDRHSGAGTRSAFERAYDLADRYGFDVTYFAATSRSGPGPLIAYYSSEHRGPIDTAGPQAEIVEKHLYG